MESMYCVDLKLLHKFQFWTERVHQYLGKNNFEISRLLYVVMVLFFLIREAIVFNDGIDINESIIIICSVLVIFKMRLMLKKAEEALKNDTEFMNPVIIDYALTRIILQFVAIGGFGFLLIHLYNIINFKTGIIITANEVKEISWDLFAVLLFLIAYLNSCTPKPTNTIKTEKHLIKKNLTLNLKTELS